MNLLSLKLQWFVLSDESCLIQQDMGFLYCSLTLFEILSDISPIASISLDIAFSKSGSSISRFFISFEWLSAFKFCASYIYEVGGMIKT